MELFDVYPLFDIEPVRALGFKVLDSKGIEYLDFYGGHAVISIGHCHPRYVDAIQNQVSNIGFYSNSVQIPMQKEIARKMGELSGYTDYNFFFCNSGAEANENALKVASFHNQRKKVIAFTGAFHGRTSGAVALTDNPNIVSPFNETDNVVFLPFNDIDALEKEMDEAVCAVITEGIQGIKGIVEPTPEFMKKIRELCDKNGAVMILDEIQSGIGRAGKFFAHQYYDVTPDLITVAKGLGNGFPVGGVLIAPKFQAKHGMLGTTFGGSHLACAAVNAVLDVIKDEKLVENSARIGTYFIEQLNALDKVKSVRGKGLMIGIELEQEVAPIRKQLLMTHKIFTGSSADKNTIRMLPPLTISKAEVDYFIEKFKKEI